MKSFTYQHERWNGSMERGNCRWWWVKYEELKIRRWWNWISGNLVYIWRRIIVSTMINLPAVVLRFELNLHFLLDWIFVLACSQNLKLFDLSWIFIVGLIVTIMLCLIWVESAIWIWCSISVSLWLYRKAAIIGVLIGDLMFLLVTC